MLAERGASADRLLLHRSSWSSFGYSVPVGLGQEAQQESLETSVLKDWAAILMPSAIVR